MRTSLKFSCWFLISLGALMTVYFATKLVASPSLIWFSLWMLLPYSIFLRLVYVAKDLKQRAVVLAGTLVAVGIAFAVYFDRAFVHFTTMHFAPHTIPLEQLVIAFATWLLVRLVRQRPRSSNHGN